LDKYIFKKSKFLNSNQCQYFIDLIENCPESDRKFDKDRGYLILDKVNPSNQWNELYNNLVHCLNEYVSLHPFLSKQGTNWGLDYNVNLQKYLPGNFYKKEHCEYGPHLEHNLRILAWMIYLNDIKKGGGTCWPQQNFISTAKEGDLYIWPAGWTHSHYGMIAPYEIKYILTGWCSCIK
tara:strand:+ start:260 stop:796 length:537 start_codon:yes stop_codon:yes gene_type:complete